MLKNALAFAALGWRVLPLYEIGPDGQCTCGKECKSPGKHPRTTTGVKGASTDQGDIRAWWSLHPQSNIGIATGAASDLLVLDIDTKEAHGVDGVGSWANLLATNGAIPMTYAVQTGSGGRQIYFRYPKGSGITIGASVLAPGIDHRGEGGYVVAPPSNHASGGVYETILDASPAEAPAWVIAGLTRPKDVPAPSSAPERQATPGELALARRKLGERCAAIESIPKTSGQGHATIVREAFTVGGLWPLSVKEREVAIMSAAARRYPELSPDTLRQVRGCLTKGAEHPINLLDDGPLELGANNSQKPETTGELITSKIEWVSGDALFAELPETKWVVPGLEICPGRPNMFAGYGFSGKTMSAQAMALAFAAGVPVWQKYVTTPGQVRHFDHEQGKHATLRRYQRLAIGLGITREALGSRLGVASFPDIRLTEAKAKDAYCRECEEVDLAIIDSLRAVVPGVDENDSNIRRYIDILSAVSEATGTAFLLIHHSGKGEGEHASIRGSSAIFDSCGCVFELKARKDKPITVTQKKGPAEGEGSQLVPFGLEISDVPVDNNPKAGVRVVCVEPAGPPDAYELRTELVLEYVTKNPGASLNKIQATVGGNKGSLGDLLTELEGSGQVVRMGTSTHQNWYTPASLQTR